MKKTAILLGATGLTGRILLQKLIVDSDFEHIKVFGRSSVNIVHPKVEEYLVDLFHLEDQTENFTGDVVFCCIGTTKAKTPEQKAYIKIDYGIPVAAAKLTKEKHIGMFQVISAMGANVKASSFYNRTKGEMERDVLAEGIENTFVFQPSLLGGKRKEKRLGERMGQLLMGAFSFMIPKQYKIIDPETIAQAMLNVAKKGYSKERILSDEIKEIANA